MYRIAKFDIVGIEIPTKNKPIITISHPNKGLFIIDTNPLVMNEFLTLYPQLGHFFAVSDI